MIMLIVHIADYTMSIIQLCEHTHTATEHIVYSHYVYHSIARDGKNKKHIDKDILDI